MNRKPEGSTENSESVQRNRFIIQKEKVFSSIAMSLKFG